MEVGWWGTQEEETMSKIVKDVRTDGLRKGDVIISSSINSGGHFRFVVERERDVVVAAAEKGALLHSDDGMVFLAAGLAYHVPDDPQLWRLDRDPTYAPLSYWEDRHGELEALQPRLTGKPATVYALLGD